MDQPALARTATSDSDFDSEHYVIVIADWEDDSSRHITIQNFILNGESFIPVFSDRAHFDAEINGSGFETKGVFVRKDFLRSILADDPLLILNPGSDAIRLRGDQLC